MNRLLLVVLYLLLSFVYAQLEATSEQLLLDYVKGADYESVEQILLDGVDVNYSEEIDV
jgi:hypothetical protein